MAMIVTRKGKRGVRYQVRIHRHGIHQSATFATRDAARTWAQMVEGYAAAHGADLVPEGVAMHMVAEAIERYRHRCCRAKVPAPSRATTGICGGGDGVWAPRRWLTCGRARSSCTATATWRRSRRAVGCDARLGVARGLASPMARVRALPEPRGRVRYLSDVERPRLLGPAGASEQDPTVSP